MEKVLVRTLISTLIALFINVIVYLIMPENYAKEVVLAIGILSLSAALPIIIGYTFAVKSLSSSNAILTGVKYVLFIINGFLILAATFSTLMLISQEIAILVSVPFIITGSYTYYQTIKVIGQAPNANMQQLSGSDLLDDFFEEVE
ncbi:MAG: Unknown protein [uncultured Aureispira sp.]|uniref:Uncharacterized protein n=1 Tax=uncultured Aureispira sp. TaxID=1331704 RepID=A0A6S6UD29_9BACT|nr:MAG: Unknown protein [uncultured Aureispira sp.]